MKLEQVLFMVETNQIALPEFQRGYVWNREQVRSLLSSLYRGYPIGAFMTWSTKAEGAATRGGPVSVDGTVKLLLDGQQRVTTLYGVMRGKPPAFFEGNSGAFTGLYFNLLDETFEFYAPAKMAGAPAWVSVTDLMQRGLGGFLPQVSELAGGDSQAQTTYFNRLNRISQIANTTVHIEEVTGDDKTLDVVVDIFNRVNSGGTKLSKGDLALAKICASWPEARQQMNTSLGKWRDAGFQFRLEWLLRNVNAVVTGEALFPPLAEAPTERVREGLSEATRDISFLLDLVAARLGLDHDRVLMGRYAFPIMTRYLHNNGGAIPRAADADRLLYWYIHASMWGRFAGSTETVLNQDLEAVDSGGLDALIANLRRMRGDLVVRENDFTGYSFGARFYPVLYLLTRTLGARDFGTGLPLSASMLGHMSGLQVHHIFPKALLYAHGYRQAEVNAVANFCFLTQRTNIDISDTAPEVYFTQVEASQPGALASQWIPGDPELWRTENYLAFLAARRALLADAANTFLESLATGGSSPTTFERRAPGEPRTRILEPESEDDRRHELDELVAWLLEQGYAEPERDTEVRDPEDDRLLAVAEAYWPQGLQEELGDPVVLELDPQDADEDRLTALGMRVFTTIAGLREHASLLGREFVAGN